jgi:photosystem II stability/assembly factor-like uncharacterized protein
MITTLYPYFGLMARWSLAVLTLFVGAALAQDPSAASCTGDDPVDGINWMVIDDGAGMTYALGASAVYRSCDDGDSWTRSEILNASPLSLLVDQIDRSIIYVGTASQGVYRSDNFGASFIATSQGPKSGGVYAMASKQNGMILAGSGTGIYQSIDRGANWNYMAGSPSGSTVRSMLVHPANDNTIFVGTNDGLYLTADGGVYWEQTGTMNVVTDLDFDPQNPSIMYAVSDGYVNQSVSGGVSWDSLNVLWTAAVAVDPVNSSIVYRVAKPDKAFSTIDGAFKSVDGGQSWSEINSGLDNVLGEMISLHVLPSRRVLVGTKNGGIYKSDDAGASWLLAGAEQIIAEPPTDGEPPVIPSNLSVNTRYEGKNGTINAGKNGKFTITVENNGPDPSTETILYLYWHHDSARAPVAQAFTATPTQGSCSQSSTSVPDCSLGTIASGARVTVDLVVTTEQDIGGTYILTVHAGNAESTEYVFTETKIKANSGLTCIAGAVCTSGGGSTGWWLLLMLGALATRSRLRHARPASFR